MNTIAHDQDTPEFQRLLKARQRVYADATRYQILQIRKPGPTWRSTA
jgi:hypothetical protein